ncbi:STR6L-like protein [Mya arenaria]|uniref:STR6L-like protein n=1 Tax=Mya arenaria TaxID=6604 RepID=A0ABY7FPM5_MYAAR|nr:STR6L-like protein [Mya arenaria]
MSLLNSPKSFPMQTPETTTPVDKEYEHCKQEVFGNNILKSYSHWFLIPSLFRLVAFARCSAKFDAPDSVGLTGRASIEGELPIVLFSLIVVIKFVWKLAKCIKQKKYSRSRSEEAGKKLCKKTDLLYVKALFNPRKYTETEEALRRDMLCLYKGDRSFIPAVLRNCPPNIYMAQGMRFIGNSIVGSFWGSIFVYVVVCVPVALMFLTFRVLDDSDKLHLLWPRFEWLIYPVCTVLIFKAQSILVAKFFMQPKLEESHKYKPLAVNNRTVYDVFSFFMLFLNASIGLVQYVKRILFSAVLGVFLIPRMDRSLYMRGDAMETTRNRATPTTENPLYADVRPEHNDKKLSIAKRRWLLAFTLVRNPELKQWRVHGKPKIKIDNSVYVDVSDIFVEDAENGSGISDNMVMDTWGCVCRCCKNYKLTIPPNIATNIMAECLHLNPVQLNCVRLYPICLSIIIYNI